jgi:flavorubredoxin
MNRIDDKIIDVTSDVKWIGILDHDITVFDIVMHTEHGTTYNSYFINAAKKTVVDTAKEKFSQTYISKLRKVTDPAEISYIVLNHTEPDHSGSMRCHTHAGSCSGQRQCYQVPVRHRQPAIQITDGEGR